ncbi:MAG TPA: PASTA domain-containing protein [Longimicrobium sp.]
MLMQACDFDFLSSAQPILIPVGCGLLLGALWFVMKESEARRRRLGWLLGLLGLGVLAAVVINWTVPRLATVPALGGLSREQAEERLVGKSLVPNARPQHADGVEAGRVITGSQSPAPGLPVECGTTVSFAVAVGGTAPAAEAGAPGQPPPAQTVELFEPRTGQRATITRRPDGVGSLTASGVWRGSDRRIRLLLWIRPVKPLSDLPGWYLQRPPGNGISEGPDGTWSGVAQIGSAQYPPHEGDVVDVAVSVADSATVARLMAEGGVVVRPEPVGVATARVTGVVLAFQ